MTSIQNTLKTKSYTITISISTENVEVFCLFYRDRRPKNGLVSLLAATYTTSTIAWSNGIRTSGMGNLEAYNDRTALHAERSESGEFKLRCKQVLECKTASKRKGRQDESF